MIYKTDHRNLKIEEQTYVFILLICVDRDRTWSFTLQERSKMWTFIRSVQII